MEPGDAVYFDANTIHSYVCCGEESGDGGDCDAAASVGDGKVSRAGKVRN